LTVNNTWILQQGDQGVTATFKACYLQPVILDTLFQNLMVKTKPPVQKPWNKYNMKTTDKIWPEKSLKNASSMWTVHSLTNFDKAIIGI